MILENITYSILATLKIGLQANQKLILSVDGIDAAGKTTFAKRLKMELKKRELQCETISLDDFHNPKSIRYQKGEYSAVGFYEDSYDYDVFIFETILPFKEGKDIIKVKHLSLELDKEESVYKDLSNCNLLIVEGIFANRKELYPFWDYSIFIDITFKEGLKRNIRREQKENTKACIDEISTKFNSRYKAGQELYLKREKPKTKVNLIIDNNDFDNPQYIGS